MQALALTTDRDYYTRAANEDCFNGGPRTRTKYGYDAANEFTGLTDSNSTTLLQQVYDNLARISSISRTSGPSESRGYGSDLRLSSQAYTFTDTSKNVTYSYTYNLAGQPMTMTPNNSAYSNTTSPAAASYASDGQNRYTTVGAHTITYDGRSNLNNDGTNSFVFDGLNRATTVNSTTFSYDALDRLYQGTSGSSIDRLLYSGRQIIAAYDGSGKLLNRYVPDLQLDRTLLWYSGASTAVSGASWLVTNAFGSVVAGAYSGTAAITTYDAFGVSGTAGLSPFNGNLGFKGMPSSGSSGIYYARARTYSASLGRFLQPDPAGYVDGLHLYAFAHNSPVNGADPTGLDCITDDEGSIIQCYVEAPRPTNPPPDFTPPPFTPPPIITPPLPVFPGIAGGADETQSQKPIKTSCPSSGLARFLYALNQIGQSTVTAGKVTTAAAAGVAIVAAPFAVTPVGAAAEGFAGVGVLVGTSTVLTGYVLQDVAGIGLSLLGDSNPLINTSFSVLNSIGLSAATGNGPPQVSPVNPFGSSVNNMDQSLSSCGH
jgi:RHS repeat-associated protein